MLMFLLAFHSSGGTRSAGPSSCRPSLGTPMMTEGHSESPEGIRKFLRTLHHHWRVWATRLKQARLRAERLSSSASSHPRHGLSARLPRPALRARGSVAGSSRTCGPRSLGRPFRGRRRPRDGEGSWKYISAPPRVGSEVQLYVLARRSVPRVIFAHRTSAHRVDMRRPLVPRRDGPADRIGEAARIEIVKHEAGAAAARLVIGRHRVHEPSGGADDRQRPVPESVELTQAAGLEARWHHEEIGAGLDAVRTGVVEGKPGAEAIALGAGPLSEVALGFGIPRAQHHQLHVPRENPVES